MYAYFVMSVYCRIYHGFFPT